MMVCLCNMIYWMLSFSLFSFPSLSLFFHHSSLTHKFALDRVPPSAAKRSTMQNDSSTYEDCFEGPEKLLEIWFSTIESIDTHNTSRNLRSIERHVWQDMLRVSVKCSVLSVISNDYMDAYLLRHVKFDASYSIRTCNDASLTLLLASHPCLSIPTR